MKPQIKKTLLHVAAIVIMLLAAVIYFLPALSGEAIIQGDMQKADAMAHVQRTVADSTGTIPNWNPAMFSGMPGYQTASDPQNSVFTPLKSLLIMRPIGLERNVGMLWLYLIGFYVAMIAFGCNPWLALLGAIGFGLGSYNIIIVEAGHITKGWAISMIAPILAGMVLCLRAARPGTDGGRKINWRHMIWGFILFTIAAGLQITFNHIQITFYTVIGGVVMGIIYLIYALKERWFKGLLVAVAVLIVGCAFAVGGNYRHLAVNQEYSKATMRGGSEITVGPDAIGLESSKQKEATPSGGLDIEYAFSWSYGIGETYTLLVPSAMGGSSGREPVSEKSAWFEHTQQNEAPLYWGSQPFTSGPVYFGAIIIFLFIYGCIVVRGPERWWLIIATLIAVIMSWGYHFMAVNGFLFDHLPLYNKFRTPSMSLVLANVTMVIMSVLAIKVTSDGMNKQKDAKGNEKVDPEASKRFSRALYIAGGITVGILLIGVILASSRLTFEGPNNDDGLKQQYLSFVQRQVSSPEQLSQWEAQAWPQLHDALKDTRKSKFVSDSWRSIACVLLAFGTLWLFNKGKIKKSGIIATILALLVAIDLWGVDRRYLNKDNFTDPKELTLRKNMTEMTLDQVAAINKDSDYRVFDLTVNTFNDSRPSAFHNEIGGYSAAKLRRYQDIIDFYLGSNKMSQYVNNARLEPVDSVMTPDAPMRVCMKQPYAVLDMLNARYIMLTMGDRSVMPVRRTTALGNCWFVDGLKYVADANAEIVALNDFDPSKTAIVDSSKWASMLSGFQPAAYDSNDAISLIHTYPYTPDKLTYKSNAKNDRVAVFSEVFYAPDWRVYIDGKPADYFRADYLLRAMVVPAGEHTIEFINEAPTLHSTDTITLIISITMLAVMAGAIVLVYRKKKSENDK